MFYTEWVRRGGHLMASAADWLQDGFFEKKDPSAMDYMRLVISMMPRQISIWLSGDTSVLKGEHPGKEVDQTMLVLYWNVLGFQHEQATKEYRPYINQPLSEGGPSRLDKIEAVAKEANADTSFYSEMHAGRALAGRFCQMKELCHRFCYYVLQKVVLMSSGNACQTKFNNTEFYARRFTTTGGGDRKFVGKGVLVQEVKNKQDQVIAIIAGTHLQSGNSTNRVETQVPNQKELQMMTCAQIREAQARQIVEELTARKEATKAKVAIFGGDLNANRLDIFDMYPQFSLEKLSSEKLTQLIQEVSGVTGFSEESVDLETLKTIINNLHPDKSLDEFKPKLVGFDKDDEKKLNAFIAELEKIGFGLDESSIITSADGQVNLVRTIIQQAIRSESKSNAFHTKIPDDIKGEPGLLNPLNPALKNGFSEALTAKTPTQVDIAELKEENGKMVAARYLPHEAVDGVFGLPGEYTLVAKGVAKFESYEDPSDHMAILAQVTLTA